jgi:hypothetical protein
MSVAGEAMCVVVAGVIAARHAFGRGKPRQGTREKFGADERARTALRQASADPGHGDHADPHTDGGALTAALALGVMEVSFLHAPASLVPARDLDAGATVGPSTILGGDAPAAYAAPARLGAVLIPPKPHSDALPTPHWPSWPEAEGGETRPTTTRVKQWFEQHRAGLTWLVPALILAAALHGWNLHHAPGPNDDEGTYVSQAWTFTNHARLAPYTYWYDHPPLGWMLLGAWNLISLAGARGESLWYAGRDAMLVVHIAACGLLFVLARRLGLPRWAAALAVALFTVSPLGLAYQRLTLLDNIGTPLLIAAWALALTPRQRLAAYAGSGLLLACAILVKETNAIFAPVIGVQVWAAARGGNRRFALSLFLCGCFGTAALYPLYAVLKGELFPGPGHVSLIGALRWQLFDRPGSGSILSPRSGTRLAVDDWLHRDWPVLLTSVAVAPVVAWRHAVARPLVAAVAVLIAILFRGGYIPIPFPINLVWPCALLAAVGVYVVSRPLLSAPQAGLRVAAAVLVMVAVGAVGARALAADRPYLTANDDREYHQAEAWLYSHTWHDDVMLVDERIWTDLVQRGYPDGNMIWFYKFDLDPAVQREHPGGWRAIDYVVESSIIGATEQGLPETHSSIQHGTVVAEFGDIHIYRLPRASTHL